ncbi:Flp pilus assembly protein CpaB [Paracoccus salsus]|uniref:Flp pilus assembly protein CpaB n=1 Tax=Paracoccus salsus TaxID=2911061 RepID=UPI001F2315AC|nr:Flp pilus assembly protein CpaB [Paracoccus salsus]MCF3972581.1 Flp pilus assembly protein CpaB [Paracoccus salsus]
MLRKAIFILALMSGGAAAWISGLPRAEGSNQVPQAAAPLEQVLVAAADIVPGSRIEAAELRWQPWPKDALNDSYITQAAKPAAADEIAGMAVRSPIMNGEPVHLGKLAPSGSGLLSVMLSRGSRAVAVRISADTSAGGFILPNDRVDVLHTQLRQGADGQSDASSRAILRKVRVLAIDQMIDADTGSVVGKTATLELRPEDVETVVSAEADGIISLALRSVGDADEADDPEPAAAEATLAQADEMKAIRVFRGIQQEMVQVRR